MARAEGASERERLEAAAARLRGALRAQVALAGEGRLISAAPVPGDPAVIDALRAELRIPEIYAEFLRHHHSPAFGEDFNLRWQGVSLCLPGAAAIDALHSSYADERWPASWVVIGAEYEGCYFIEVEAGWIGYLDHGVGLDYEEAAADLPDFLLQVAARTGPPPPSAAHAAAAADDVKALAEALAGEGAPDESSLTVLGVAVLYGAGAAVDHLLDHGAASEARSPALGWTPLGMALGTGQKELADRLFARGADPKAAAVQEPPKAGAEARATAAREAAGGAWILAVLAVLGLAALVLLARCVAG
ncbi:MAG: hypothetical protein H6711_08615 [Myxococcales bacterium]|nr:hypothetical protein [Myxococcales bacterium]